MVAFWLLLLSTISTVEILLDLSFFPFFRISVHLGILPQKSQVTQREEMAMPEIMARAK